MDYKQKYYKYKLKYINLKKINIHNRRNLINEMYGGGKYDCNPSKNFKEICFEKENGKYKSKESCINDCENKYITHNLVKANIKGESLKFQLFIKSTIFLIFLILSFVLYSCILFINAKIILFLSGSKS